jgi:NADH-quinone oxidoreductase subunit A
MMVFLKGFLFLGLPGTGRLFRKRRYPSKGWNASQLGTSYEMLVNGQTETLWTLGVYFVVVLLLVAAMLALSYVLGQRHNERATGSPYESGILSEGSARVRLSAKFYLVAMFFVIFDLEAVFIFAWAVAARELGWAGYQEIFVFIAILVAALAYLWRLGALDWGPSRRVTRVGH